MKAILQSPLFGIVVTIAAYNAGLWLNRRLKSPLVNPLLVATALVILFLNALGIPLESYDKGGSVISLFLAPATAVLAVSIYRQLEVLKEHFLPVVLGCLAGAVTSMGSAFLLCRFFKLDDSLVASMLPKSVTTPIAIEISRQGGGIVAVTVAAVIFTGILGAMFAPVLVRVFRIKSPVAVGVAIGACSHAMGTSKAIELGEVEGAMSGIAIGVSGILTVILALFLY